MRVKSKYRQQYRDGGRVDLPGQELPIEPPAEQPTETVSEPPEAPPAEATVEQQPASTQPELPQQDDATLALKKQIDGLRHSAELQRQRAAQAAMPAQPMSREARLAEWQAQGLSDAEVQFFQNHPAMVDFPQLTGFAIHRAKEAGHERGTDAHFAFVEKAFNAQVENMMRGEQGQAGAAMQTPTPAFFKPPPGPAGRSAPKPSSFVSAPVSRDIPSGGSGKRHTPGKVMLSAQEVEAARISGISPEEYAKQKIRKAEMIASGEYGEQPQR